MKYFTYALLLFLVSCSQYDASQPIDFSEWVGTWKHVDGEMVILESWKPSVDGDFFGVNVSKKGEETKINETINLQQRNGKWIMTPYTAGQNPDPVKFELSSNKNREVIFSNPNHDFPKYISYKMISKDEMEAKISDGGEVEISWRFKRQANLEQFEISYDEYGRPFLK